MRYKITAPRKLTGTIHLTASKSESNRVLIIRALTAPFTIHNLAAAQDTQTLEALLASDEALLDVGPAGTTMRFLTAYLSICEGTHTLTGSERMQQRPIGILVDALRVLGADIQYKHKEGYPPLHIEGKSIAGGTVTMDGSVSSQFITALLLVAPVLEQGLTIRFDGEVASRPYVTMTLEIMRYFGAEAAWQGNAIVVQPGGYQPRDFVVEADWSAASYWYALAALAETADFTIMGLKQDSLQGDAAIVKLFEPLGVQTHFITGGVRITRANKPLPTAFHSNFEDCPDVAQTLACVCAGLGIAAHMEGLKSLRIKETDRSLALKTELAKLGITSRLEGDDQLHIDAGAIKSTDAAIATYEDHRMAMAFAPLALVLDHVVIADPKVVGKSYPAFWDDLRSVGFQITEIE